jgi:phytoene synthase
MNPARFVSRLTRKSRSNFFYAFLCLPRPKREALYAVYAFCRIVDDAVDVGQDRAAQRKELERWRAEIAQVFEGRPVHPAAQRLQEAVKIFPIPRAALEEIIAGVEMDLERSTYTTFDELYPYCYRVASAVGLCCIEIFGYTDLRAREYAVNLGVALQLTNIMRDVQPDALAGRVYLPQEDLQRFGVTADDLAAGRYTPGFVRLMEHEARRARSFYEAAWAALPRVDQRTLFAAEIMGRTYFALLETIERRRFRVFGRRVSVSTPRKLGIALRCWVQSRWGQPRWGQSRSDQSRSGKKRA